MADDLEPQVTDPEPVPEPVAEPPVAAEPEPAVAEPEPIEPEWLYGDPDPQPPQYPPQQPYPQAPPPQYQQPPQEPVMSQGEIEDFIRRGPRAVFDEYMQSNPIQHQVMGMMGAVNNYLEAEIRRGETQAADTISAAYREIFSKDEAFRSNPALRQRIDASLQGLLNNARSAARNGQFDDLNSMRNFGPNEARAALAAAKAMLGVTGTQPPPVNMTGAAVEQARPATTARHEVELTAEEEAHVAAYERADPGFRDRLMKAKQETAERGDFEAY